MSIVSLSTVDASTGQIISKYEIIGREQVTLTLNQAGNAFPVVRDLENGSGKKKWDLKH
jgi:hypothetical protein